MFVNMCRLLAIASLAVLDVYPLTLAALDAVFLPRVLPHNWRHQKEVGWDPEGSTLPNIEWLMWLWEWLQVIKIKF